MCVGRNRKAIWTVHLGEQEPDSGANQADVCCVLNAFSENRLCWLQTTHASLFLKNAVANAVTMPAYSPRAARSPVTASRPAPLVRSDRRAWFM